MSAADKALRKKYGLGLGERYSLSAWQEFKCAICGVASKALCLDHDHVTGKTRGLLCCSCNNGLAMIEPGPLTIDIAAKRLGAYRNGFTKHPGRLPVAVEYINHPPYEKLLESGWKAPPEPAVEGRGHKRKPYPKRRVLKTKAPRKPKAQGVRMTTPNPAIDAFSAAMHDDNLGERTIEEYAGIVKRGLAAADPMTYIKGIKNAGSRMMPIAAFQRWAAYVGDNALALALAAYKKQLRHRIPPSKDRQPYSPQEMERMVAGVGTAGRSLAERFALKMLLGTGARSSDICSGVTREVLQLAQRSGGVAEIRTKGLRLRKINFSWFDSDIKALLAQKGWEQLFELLAPARDDRPVSNKRGYRVLDLRFKDLCTNCNVSEPHITHRCRHTVASMVYSKTHDLMATRNWFGWASTQTAERYSHGAKFDEIDKSVSDILPHFEDGPKPKKPPKGKRNSRADVP